MASSGSRIIESASWQASPVGRYLLAWEQASLDRLVGDIFGFHALQLGRPSLDALRANRMPHRWRLNDIPWQTEATQIHHGDDLGLALPPPRGLDLLANFEALPFPSQSLDLVVLPHTLELAEDAHQTLREVERVLMPEGRVIVMGFNPSSLWGLSCQGRRAAAGLGLRAPVEGGPHRIEAIGPRRLRDWFRLLGLQVETGHFGCWRPTWVGERWLERSAWMEQAGERWWPFFGSLYVMVAVKRVRAMRLIGPAWKQKRKASGAPAVATHHRDTHHRDAHPRDAGARRSGTPPA